MTNTLIRISRHWSHCLAGARLPIMLGVGMAWLAQGCSSAGGHGEGGRVEGGDGIEAASVDDTPAEPEPDLRLLRLQARHEFIRYIDDIEPGVRLHWSDMLREMKDASWAQAAFERFVPEPDAEVKASLARTLGALGLKAAVEPLSDNLRAVEPSHGVWYREALCRLDHRPSCRTLRRLTRQRDLAVAFKSTLALADMSRPNEREAIRALTALARREAELKQFDGLAGISILTRLARLRHQRARNELTALLQHDDEQVRLAAAKGMAWIGDDSGKEVLMQVFNDGQSAYRLDAAVAMVWLGNYAGHHFLRDQLADASAHVRELSARTLGMIGDRDNVRSLIELYEDADHSVRISAAAAVLFILGLDPRLLAQDSVNWVMATFRSEDWRIRRSAAAPLRYLASAQAIPLLAQGIVDAEPQVRVRFAAEAAHLGSEATSIVVEALRHEIDGAVQEAQIATLAKLRDPTAKGVLSDLVTASHRRVGVLALGALIAVGELGGVERLAAIFAEGQYEARLAAVEAAELASDRGVIPMLERALDDVAAAIRLAAAKALASYGVTSERVVTMLRDALKQAPRVAEGALAALLAAGVSPGEEGLRIGVGPLGAENAGVGIGVVDMVPLLDSANEDVRNAVLRAVAAAPWREAEPVLREAMRHPDVRVRQQATDVLHGFAQAHGEEVVPMLKMAMQDEDPVTRTKSKAQLSQLLPPLPQAQSLSQEAADSGNMAGVGQDAAAASTAAYVELVMRERRQFIQIEGEIEMILTSLSALLDGRAGSERDVEEVARRAAQLRRTQGHLLAAYGRIGIAAHTAEGEGIDPAGIDPQARMEAEGHVHAARQRVAESSDRVEETLDRVAQWLKGEQADCPYYLSAAQAAIIATQPAMARRDLQRAEQACHGQSNQGVALDYAWAMFHDMQAALGKNVRQRHQSLVRARTRYRKVADVGSGVRRQRAQQRLAEIAQVLGPENAN